MYAPLPVLVQMPKAAKGPEKIAGQCLGECARSSCASSNYGFSGLLLKDINVYAKPPIGWAK